MQKKEIKSLNTSFQENGSIKQPSRLETHIQEIRDKAEHEIAELQMAAEVCTELGYNVDDVTIQTLKSAIDTVSRANGFAHGDIYKPFNTDMAFADKDSLKIHLEDILPRFTHKTLTSNDLTAEL